MDDSDRSDADVDITTEMVKAAENIDPEWLSNCCSVPVFHMRGFTGMIEDTGFTCLKCNKHWWNLSSNAYITEKPVDWDDAMNIMRILAK